MTREEFNELSVRLLRAMDIKHEISEVKAHIDFLSDENNARGFYDKLRKEFPDAAIAEFSKRNLRERVMRNLKGQIIQLEKQFKEL